MAYKEHIKETKKGSRFAPLQHQIPLPQSLPIASPNK
jgi:hypothetical protein